MTVTVRGNLGQCRNKLSAMSVALRTVRVPPGLYLFNGNPAADDDCATWNMATFSDEAIERQLPYAKPIDSDTLAANVHPHCNCTLSRLNSNADKAAVKATLEACA